MGILGSGKRKKNKKVENDLDREFREPLDYFEERDREGALHCPECAKAQKHVRLVKTEGEDLECPECHYLRSARRS